MVRLGSPGVRRRPGSAHRGGRARAAGRGLGRARSSTPPPTVPGARDRARARHRGRRPRRPILDVLAGTDRPAVVDGDGLTALGARRRSVLAARAAPTVLTPHDGEFERLAGSRPSADRLAAARSLADAGWARSCCSRARPPSSPHPTARCGWSSTATPAWPPPAPATCSAASIGALLARGRRAARGGGRRRLAARPRRRGRARRRAGGRPTSSTPCPACSRRLASLMARAWADVSLGRDRGQRRDPPRRCARRREVCAVVKADGYGHGAVPVARAAVEGGAAWLAVAQVRRGHRAAGRRHRRRRSCCSPSRRPPTSTRPSPPGWWSPPTPSRSIRRLGVGRSRPDRPCRSTSRSTPGCTASAPRPRRRRPPRRAGATPSRACRSTGCGPTARSPTSPTTRSPRSSSSGSTPRSPPSRGPASGCRCATPPTRPPRSPTRRAATTSCAAASRSTASRRPRRSSIAWRSSRRVRLATEVAFVKPVAAGERRVLRPAAHRRARHHRRHAARRLRRRRAPPARPGGPGGADRRPPPPDDRRRHDGPGARRPRARQRRAGRATRPCCSARRAVSGSRPTSGRPGSAPSPTRWCARSAQGSSAGTDAPRLLRRDRGRHHRLRRRDARPGATRCRRWLGRAT